MLKIESICVVKVVSNIGIKWNSCVQHIKAAAAQEIPLFRMNNSNSSQIQSIWRYNCSKKMNCLSSFVLYKPGREGTLGCCLLH